MFSEVLKIIPRIDRKELANMEKQLGSRFTKIAKSFGKGITNIFKGGGFVGLAIGLIDKVLNPLKEVQEAIDRTLKSSDDIVTNAQQFGTTTGNLFKLVKLAQSSGLEQDNLFELINKFQTAVAQARANPTDAGTSAVRNYINTPDTAEGFFAFIQQLQKLDKGDQLRVQEQIFGEKQILKMANFIQLDMAKQLKAVGLDKISSDKLSSSIEKLGTLNDLADVLTARRETQDIMNKSGTINEGMIRERDKSERIALERENSRIKSYSDLAAISQTTDNIMKLLEQGTGMLGSLINTLTPAINKMVKALDKFMQSPMVRGIKGFFGGKDE